MAKRKDWVETEGTVEEVYVDGGGRDQRISVVFMYTVEGHYYSGTYTPWTQAPVKGEKLTVKYDPDDPNKNDLVTRDLTVHWIMGVIIALFVIGFIVVHLM